MKLTSAQIDTLARKLLESLETSNSIQFGQGKDKAVRKAVEILQADYAKEIQLEKEVHAEMDRIEEEHSDQFQRHRMFKMLKTKMADERGMVL